MGTRDGPELLRAALDIECRRPRHAMRLYSRLRGEQTEFNKAIFVAALVGVVTASSVGYLVTRRLDSDQTAVEIAFLAVGLSPMVLLRTQREARRRRWRLRRQRTAVWLVPLAVVVIVSDWLKALAVALTAALALAGMSLLLAGGSRLILSDPWSLTEVVDMPWIPWLAVALSVYLSVAYVVDVSSWHAFWLPWHAVPEMLAGLKEQLSEVLGFFASVALGWLLFGATSLGLLNQGYWLTVASAVGTAVLFGLSAAFLEEADATPAVLRRLGEIRCSLRLRRVGAARWRLNRLYSLSADLASKHHFSQRPPSSLTWLGPAMDVLAGALGDLLERHRSPGYVAMADEWVRARDWPADWASAPRWRDEDWRSTLLDDRWVQLVALAMAPYGHEWRTSVANTRDLLSDPLTAYQSELAAANRRRDHLKTTHPLAWSRGEAAAALVVEGVMGTCLDWPDAPDSLSARANAIAGQHGVDVDNQSGVAGFVDAIMPVCLEHVQHESDGRSLNAEEAETVTTAARSALQSALRSPQH